MKGIIAIIFLHVFLITVDGYAEGDDKKDTAGRNDYKKELTAYEPNRIGWTFDDDDGFMDFMVSLKYPLLNSKLLEWRNSYAFLPEEFYFSFTGRFGQYIGTRDSAPVIGKRFNPKLFMRYRLTKINKFVIGDRIDIGYGHESNGQSISTYSEYVEKQMNVDEPSYANDYISRGWDYLEIEWKGSVFEEYKKRENQEGSDGKYDEKYLKLYLNLRYFLSNGIFQGRSEEYNDWENDIDGKKRNSVSGIKFTVKYRDDTFFKSFDRIFNKLKAAVVYETGYSNPFKNNTIRLEVGSYVTFPFVEVPLSLWWSHGYNSDLAMYYKQQTSFGITIEMASF